MPALAAAFAIAVQQVALAVGFTNAAILASTAFSVGSALIGAGVSLGLAFLGQALAPKPKQPKPSDGRVNLKQPIPPRRLILGKGRVGGNYFVFESKAGRMWQGIILAQGPSTAIEQIWLHDDVVTVDGGTGVVTAPAHFGIAVSIWTRLGQTPGIPYAELTAEFPEFWTSDHRGDDLTTLLCKCINVEIENHQKFYPNGLPQPSALVAGQKCYDHRDAGQDPDDPDTWEWSDNPAVLLRWYLTSRWGIGLSDAQRIAPNNAEWDAAADACDRLLKRKDGSYEKQYRCWVQFDLTAPRAQVLAQILRSFDGWLYPKPDGTLGIKAGEYTPAALTIGQEHVRSNTVRFNPRREKQVNELKLEFLSAAHGYKETPGDPWRDEAAITADGLRSEVFDATQVPSHSQARRLAKRAFLRANAKATGQSITDLYGFNALGQRFTNLYVTGLGVVEVEVTKLTVDTNTMTAAIDWLHLEDFRDLDRWDRNAEEGTEPPVPQAADEIDPPVPTGFTAENLGGIPAAHLEWDAPGFEAFLFELQYRVSPLGPWIFKALGHPPVADSNYQYDLTGLDDGGAYDLQLRSRYGSKVSDWTATVTVTVRVNATPPAAVLNMSASETGGVVTISWTAPNDPNYAAAKVYRAVSGAGFGAATVVAGPVYGTPNNDYQATNIPPTGTWDYWVVSENISAIQGPEAGPDTVTTLARLKITAAGDLLLVAASDKLKV